VERSDWQRYAAPAAFLLAVTVAVFFVRAALRPDRAQQPGGSSASTTQAPHTVSTTTVGTTAAKAAARRFWTVRAGDTFSVIAARTGVSVAVLESLNPNVSPTTLFIGEKIRIR
jgi:LysM repeat protein